MFYYLEILKENLIIDSTKNTTKSIYKIKKETKVYDTKLSNDF